jgi:ABC-type transporter MlaC component
MHLFFKIVFFIFLIIQSVSASESSNWLKTEIDFILKAYKNSSTTSESRFLMIENTINYNFAGAGIAKFVAGKAWAGANKNTKKEYLKLFKRHLALNIASMMQGYSDQKYELINNKYDSKSKVSLIDMEIYNDTGSLIVTWRVKKSKERYYIIDLLVADISLVVTKRSEFNSMLKTVNYDLYKFNKLLKDQNESSFNKIIN